MFGNNRNKKVGLCVMVVTACLVLAGIWAVLATPETALAKKPDGSKGGGKYLHLSVTFRDADGDRVTSDASDDEDGTYYDGEDKVIALAYKLFRFDTTRGASSHKGGKRTVTLDLSGFDDSPFDQDPIVEVPVDMRLGFEYTVDEYGNGSLKELDVSGMGEGEGNAIQATMSIHFEYNGEPYGLAFGHIAQFIDVIEENTGCPVTVTRTGPETWTIATDDQAALYLLDWKNGPIYYGDSIMPFLVTLVVQK